jgi:biofilm PGA synthesis N-glycosyltransferase PgaC
MLFWKYTFIISCLVVLYNYIGYAVLAAGLQAIFRRSRRSPAGKDLAGDHLPGVSFIVAAYNEEGIIRDKIQNSLGQDYPPDKLEIIFITDGSSDNSPGIIREYPSIRLLHEPRRQGKSVAVNRAVRVAEREVLIFSDANTILNKEAVRLIAAHYRDAAVGGVAGEKKVLALASSEASGQGEGLYWRYESRLKKIDSDFYSVVGAAGELFSLRRDLYEPLPENTILDDFVLSLRVAEQSFRIIYEPGAFAAELPSFSTGEEQKRKIRIAAGGFQAMVMLRSLFCFWRHPRLSFLYISHRVLRWTLSPLCLILAFISNAFLYFSGNQLFKLSFLIQATFYGLALLSLFPGLRKSRFNKFLTIPYYFTFMNVSVILGFFRFLKGSQSAVWEKARRAEASINTEQ